MKSTGMIKVVDRLRWIIKLVFGLLLKFIFLLIWGLSLWGFCNLLYDRYVLGAYPLRDYLPVLIFTFGNIWLLPGIILWYEKLYPAFDKPEIYYRVKAWSISLKEESFVGMLIFYGIEIFIKLGLFMYGTIIVLAIVIFVSLHLLRF
ncbi:MAG: hypothetical protein KH401_04830 [Veillonella dispar]|uniref:hypothetical protein n=1 Tax=Veillonella dispar TaxID=39778 RepID=UPI0026EA4820|nr:hypothetical protein [Veillonella dispar]MBS6382804.1 hypothetical protein [Veillonella dispar]